MAPGTRVNSRESGPFYGFNLGKAGPLDPLGRCHTSAFSYAITTEVQPGKSSFSSSVAGEGVTCEYLAADGKTLGNLPVAMRNRSQGVFL